MELFPRLVVVMAGLFSWVGLRSLRMNQWARDSIRETLGGESRNAMCAFLHYSSFIINFVVDLRSDVVVFT